MKKERIIVIHSDMVRMNFEDKMKRTDFFVEAESFTKDALYSKYFENNEDKDKLYWLNDGAGFGKVVGHIDRLRRKPVTVLFTFAAIGDKYICFYNPTSRFVDWTMVENWIEKHCPVTYDNGTRSAMTDASNFHQCYNFCKNE